MSEKKVKHFIMVRFFPKQNRKYLYNILSEHFLRPQLVLANNLFNSLNNQTNKNFELVFIMHPWFIKSPNYEFVLSGLKVGTTVPVTFVTFDTLLPLVEKAFEEYEYVIQTRMDFDDFVYKDAVADAQSKVDTCDSVLSYGYCKGYSYLDGDLLPYYNLCSEVGHHSVFQSLILKSSFAKEIGSFTVFYGAHNKIKDALQKRLEQNNFEYSDNMFQQDTTTNAFIYYRHEGALHPMLINKMNPSVTSQIKNKLTSADITKKQLKEEFGFELELNSIE